MRAYSTGVKFRLPAATRRIDNDEDFSVGV
jgi:hypothetical protein